MYGRHIVWINRVWMANPARGQLNRENSFFPCPRPRLKNLVSRDRFGRPVPRQPPHSPSRLRLNLIGWCLLTGFLPLSATASTDNVNRHRSPVYIRSHPIAYRWRSLPRVRRHRASSRQGGSSNGCCLFRNHHGPIFVRFSFPAPSLGTEDTCNNERIGGVAGD